MTKERESLCDNCGACCMGQNLVPLDADREGKYAIPPALLAELLAIAGPEGAFGPLSGDDGCPCVWLDRATGKCKHYEYRPRVCRDFKVGCETCIAQRIEVGLLDARRA